MNFPAFPSSGNRPRLKYPIRARARVQTASPVTFISAYLAKDLKLCFNKFSKQPLKGTLIQRGGGIRPYNTSATGRVAVKVPIPAEKKYLEDKRVHMILNEPP